MPTEIVKLSHLIDSKESYLSSLVNDEFRYYTIINAMNMFIHLIGCRRFCYNYHYCKRFEPRNHFISRLSMIVRVNAVLNRNVVYDSDGGFDNLCGGHLQSKVSSITSSGQRSAVSDDDGRAF